ncbi:zinc-dependent alcohol dehydrogenase family protein [Frankia tisae]|uniref:zinc-dependent alcohol dehydrogenase family protein n=1 Tax=Frankia tisae TaxID=2950104 RepID=UPI0021C0A4F6|nr:zinc-dependent alcohol dehydrogenase family protein [Frankia tisae]
MRATLLEDVGKIALREFPDPVVQRPTDAVVRVTASCICGSDLHPYRGKTPSVFPKRIGHEFVGVVEDIGDQVGTVRPGDVVVAPFLISCGACRYCRAGLQTSCENGSVWGTDDGSGARSDACQGDLIRAPLADGTLVRVGTELPDALLPDVLALSDVMGTGHHAAVSAGVGPGSTVVVVGDGAVGLCAVLAARRLGAERVVAMSRTPSRQKLAAEFGATDIVAGRGAEGIAQVLELLGDGADAVLECVGSQESLEQAAAVAHPGGRLGCVGAPLGNLPLGPLFMKNVRLAGGVAPVRAYLPELLADVLAGRVRPGRIFDLELPLDEVAEGYRAMDERRAIKVLLRP